MAKIKQLAIKKHLKELTKEFFAGATVIWTQKKRVKPKGSMVLLTLGDMQRPISPIRQTINGIIRDVYPSRTYLQVDLYTDGLLISEDERENTAVSDLTDFVNFLNSPHVDVWCDTHDIDIGTGIVRDLTSVINDSSWQYRAMTEVQIGFTQVALGHTATGYEQGDPLFGNRPFQPNASGGGTQELAELFTGHFEEVKLTHE